ncbi:MAG: cupin domain-containing protein [Bradyrhizobiaceae bacterium]|nr:cupin domain-containing protein [Bradyrhizobiaceae bacterium]
MDEQHKLHDVAGNHPADRPLEVFRAFFANFRWEDVAFLPYKEEGTAPFKSVSRQVLFHDRDLRCELRYFEVAPGGYSTLERHRHVHAVMILRGAADVLVGSEVRAVRCFDLVRIPPMTWHQFRTRGKDPMGFLCMVNAERDRPQLPDEEDLRRLRSDPTVAAFLSGKDRLGVGR